jgi:hypothetical protein
LKPKKKVIFLLHFPPSSLVSSQFCYPALYIYGWDFFFLDSFDSSEGIEGLDFDELRLSLSSKKSSAAETTGTPAWTHARFVHMRKSECFSVSPAREHFDLRSAMRIMLKDVLPRSFVNAKARGLQLPSYVTADSLFDVLVNKFPAVYDTLVSIFTAAWGTSLPDELFRRAAEMVHEKHLYLDLVQATKRFFEERLIEFWTLMLLEMTRENVIQTLMSEADSLDSKVLEFIVSGFENIVKDIKIHALNSHIQWVQNKRKSCPSIFSSDFSEKFMEGVSRFPWFDSVHRAIEKEISTLENLSRSSHISASVLSSRLGKLNLWFWEGISHDCPMRTRYLEELLTNLLSPNKFERRTFYIWFSLHVSQSVPDWHILVSQNIDLLTKQLSTLRCLRELETQPDPRCINTSLEGLNAVELVLGSPNDLRTKLPTFALRFMVFDFFRSVSAPVSLQKWMRALTRLICDAWNPRALGEDVVFLDLLHLFRSFFLNISDQGHIIEIFANQLSCCHRVSHALKSLGVTLPKAGVKYKSLIETAFYALNQSLDSFSQFPPDFVLSLRRILIETFTYTSLMVRDRYFDDGNGEAKFMLELLSSQDLSNWSTLSGLLVSASNDNPNFRLFPESLRLQVLINVLTVSESLELSEADVATLRADFFKFRPQVRQCLKDIVFGNRILHDSEIQRLENVEKLPLLSTYGLVCSSFIRKDIEETTALTLEALTNYYLRFERQNSDSLSLDPTDVLHRVEANSMKDEFQRRFALIIASNLDSLDIEIDINNTTVYFKHVNDIMEDQRNIPFWMDLVSLVGVETIDRWLSDKKSKILRFWNWFSWKEDWVDLRQHFLASAPDWSIAADDETKKKSRNRRARAAGGKIGEFVLDPIPVALHTFVVAQPSYQSFILHFLDEFQKTENAMNFFRDSFNAMLETIGADIEASSHDAINKFFSFSWTAIYFHGLRHWELPMKEKDQELDLLLSFLQLFRDAFSNNSWKTLCRPTHTFEFRDRTLAKDKGMTGILSWMKGSRKDTFEYEFHSSGSGSSLNSDVSYNMKIVTALSMLPAVRSKSPFNFFTFLTLNQSNDARMQGFLDCVSNLTSVCLAYPAGRNHLWFLMFQPSVLCTNNFARIGCYFDSNNSISLDAGMHLPDGTIPSFWNVFNRPLLFNTFALYVMHFFNYAALWVGLSLETHAEFPTLPSGIIFNVEDQLEELYSRALTCFDRIRARLMLSFEERNELVSMMLNLGSQNIFQLHLNPTDAKDKKLTSHLLSLEEFNEDALRLVEHLWLKEFEHSLTLLQKRSYAFKAIDSISSSQEIKKSDLSGVISFRPSFDLFDAGLTCFCTDITTQNKSLELLFKYVRESPSWSLLQNSKQALRLYLWLKSTYEGRLRKDHAQVLSIQELIQEQGSHDSRFLSKVLEETIAALNGIMSSDLVSPAERLPLVSGSTEVIRFLTTSKYHDDENDYLCKLLNVVIRVHNDFVDKLSKYYILNKDRYQQLQYLCHASNSAVPIQQLTGSSIIGPMTLEFKDDTISFFLEPLIKAHGLHFTWKDAAAFDFPSIQFYLASRSFLLTKVKFRKLETETIFSEFRFRDTRKSGQVVEGNEYLQLPNQFHDEIPSDFMNVFIHEYHALDLVQIERKLEALKSVAALILGQISQGMFVEFSTIGEYGESFLDAAGKRELLGDNFLKIIDIHFLVRLINFFQQKLDNMDYVYANVNITKKKPLEEKQTKEISNVSSSIAKSDVVTLKSLNNALSFLLKCLDVKSVALESNLAMSIESASMTTCDEVTTSEDPQQTLTFIKRYQSVFSTHNFTGEVVVEIHRLLSSIRSSCLQDILRRESSLLSQPFYILDSEAMETESRTESTISVFNLDINKFREAYISFVEHPLTTLLAGVLGTQEGVSEADSSWESNRLTILNFLRSHSVEDGSGIHHPSHTMKGEAFLFNSDDREKLHSFMFQAFPYTQLALDQNIDRDAPRRAVLALEENVVNGTSSIVPVLRTIIGSVQSFLREKVFRPALLTSDQEESSSLDWKEHFNQMCKLSVIGLSSSNLKADSSERQAFSRTNLEDEDADTDSPEKVSGSKKTEKNLFILSWPNLYLTGKRATLLEEKVLNHLQQERADGVFNVSFSRVSSIPAPMTCPSTHSASHLGLSYGEVISRTWTYWGCFDADASYFNDPASTSILETLSHFDIQVDEKMQIEEEIQARIQHELLPTIKRQMKQIEEFLLSLNVCDIDEKQMDSFLHVFNEKEIRTLEDLRQLTNAQIEDIVITAEMSDELGEAIYAFRDKFIENVLQSALHLDTLIEDALEVVREQIPGDFNRDELSSVLAALQTKKVSRLADVQKMDKRTYERILKRLNLSSRCTDLLMFVQGVELQDGTEEKEADVDEDVEEENKDE